MRQFDSRMRASTPEHTGTKRHHTSFKPERTHAREKCKNRNVVYLPDCKSNDNLPNIEKKCQDKSGHLVKHSITHYQTKK